MNRQDRLKLIYEVLAQLAPVNTEADVFSLMEEAFDRIEDAHSGVPKNPNAHLSIASDGRMYPPHPSFRIPSLTPATFRHRAGHKTVIGKNGSFRIYKVEADLNETVVFEKRGADGKGYWET